MGILLTAAEIYIPQFIRRRKLQQLFAATADAFAAPMPQLAGLKVEEFLEQYALFTKQKAEESLRKGAETRDKSRLYANASYLGMSLRSQFGVRNMKDTMRLARLVYRMVGIDFSGSTEGDVVIRRCYFSAFYAPEVCGIISSLDAGLLSGLSGGARLGFTQRLTEGGDCCRARLLFGVLSK